VLRYSISLLLLIFLSLLVQQFLPVFQSCYQARVLVMLVVFLCASLTVPLPVMFIFAMICGLFWDMQCVQIQDQLDPTVYGEIPSPRFGSSMLLYGFAGALMHGVKLFFHQKKWFLVCFMIGIATFIYLMMEYGLIDFLRNQFTMSFGVMMKIGITSIIHTLVSPLIFLILTLLSDICHLRFGSEALNQNKRKASLLKS
jgi:cell shape-determining protein MreD